MKNFRYMKKVGVSTSLIESIKRESNNRILMLRAFVLMLILMLFNGMSVNAQSFDSSNLNFNGFAGVNNATSLEFGPDGNLYVAEEDGLVKVYTIQRNGIKDYDVTAVEVLTLVQSIPNHDDDDGSLGGPSNRQVTGITVTGTAADPEVYVSSSDRRRGAGGGGGDDNLDTNSGVITRLTKNGSGVWQAVDIVRGLPRSEENHATNGMQFVTIGLKDWLIVSSGGFTNAGSPSNNFAYITEYALSGAVLALDLNALEALPILNDGARDYIYDIPTLDDPTRANANGITDPDNLGYDGVDINDPWGGNDGLNMGMLIPGSPVKMFSPGYRNSYDNIITEDGHVYVTDNGANPGWGGFPEFEGDAGQVSNNYRSGEPGSGGPDAAPNSTPFDPQVNNSDHLNLVSTDIDSYVFGSVYGGHPCPVRANENAGLFTRGAHSPGGTGQTFSDSYFRTVKYDPNGTGDAADPQKALPANWPPVHPSLINAENADFRQPTQTPGINPEGPNDIIVVNWSNNTNAIAEYTASNFGGIMQGDLVAGKGNALHRVDRDASGNIIGFEESKFTGITGNALGVDCQGDSDIFPGTIWVANYNGDDIVILEPADFVICILPGETGYQAGGDNDSDGYTNDDEFQNGTDLCSGASQPTDFDGDLVSDLLDLDDDADGINDDLDPLQMGTAFDLPVENELFLGTDLGGFLGLGFTGLMNNGDANPNYLDWQDDPFASTTDIDDILGGAIGAVTMFQTTGNATTNNQEKAYQYGINVDNTTNGFTIHGRMFPPFHNFSATESQGMFIGDGFQENYVKIILGQNYELSIVGENSGSQVTYVSSTNVGLVPASTDNFDIFFDVNPATGSVQAKYQINNGSTNNLGSPFTLQGGTLTSLQSSSDPLIVGIIGTADSNDGFAANWDFLNVIGSVPFVSQQLSDLDRLIDAPSEVIGLDSYFGDDNGAGNLTFTVQGNTNTAIGATIVGNNLTLTYPGTAASSAITIRATDSDNFFIDQTFTVSVTDAPTALFRVNANGQAYTDGEGEDWVGDNYFVGGSGYAKVGQAIGNTTDDELYEEERFGNFSYEFPVANGDYTVELHFAEIYFGLPGGGSAGGVGSRIFNVNIEGETEELSNYDIVADVGPGNAVIKSFPITVTDGTLNIVFTTVTNNAKVSAIAILGSQISGAPITVNPIPDQTSNLGVTPVLSAVASGGESNETFFYQETGLPPGLTIENTNGSILGTVSTDPNDAGTYPVSVTVSKPSSTPVTINFVWNVVDPNVANAVLYRVNTGGALTASNDSSPIAWEEDQSAATANGSANTGTPSQYVNSAAHDKTYGAAIPGGFVNATGYPNALFATERYNENPVPNNMQWSFPTGNGDFQVNLLFNENWANENAQPQNNRIFDVEIENLNVLDDYRPSFDGTQINIAKVETFLVTVNDGILNIDFVKINQNPAIKGIEILSTTPGANDQWTEITNVSEHIARHENSFVQAGEKFYLFGGRESADKMNIYDYSTDTWSLAASTAPFEFNHFQAVEYQGLIWVIGAFKENAGPEPPADNIFMYNPVTDTWIQGPAVPAGRKRGSAGLVMYNNKFYVVGGNTIGHNGGYVPWFDEFDPATGAWTPLIDAPHARDHFHAALIDNKLYAVGGRLSGGPGGTFAPLVPEIDVYDFATSSWSTLPAGSNLPNARAASGTVNFNGDLVVIGGEGDGQAYVNVDAFDVATGIWTSLDDLNNARHGTQGIVSGDGIWITSGSPNQGGGSQTNMEVYGTDNPTGTQILASTLGTPASVLVPAATIEEFTISNTVGNQGIYVTSIAFTGANASNFSIVGNTNFLVLAGGTSTISVSHTGALEGEVASLDISYGGSSNASISLITGPPISNVLFRVNAGGAIVADPVGDFEEDQRASGTGGGTAVIGTPSPYINITPPAVDNTFGSTAALVENNTGYPDVVFQTERWSDAADPDNMQWSFPTGDGTFQVNLLFNENWADENANANNNRIFDVEIENQLLLDDYRPSGDGTDVNIAKVESFQVTITDGILNINFIKGNQNPAIKGIEILNVITMNGEGPVVTNPGAQVGVEGDLVSLPIIAVDGTTPICGPLSYSAENLPANVTIDPNTGIISGTLLAGTGSGTSGAFIEQNGIVVIEMESTENLPGSWVNASEATSPNINNPGSATGGDFIVWEGPQFLGSQGTGLISYPVEITTTGIYKFEWRTQIGNGTNSTDHNDTWLKIEADSFYGQKGGTGGTTVCPKGFVGSTNDCTGNAPNGAGGNGWFKVYSSASAANWTWSTFTSDNDGHQIFARFDSPGTYNILVSARSSNQALDRMVLSHESAFSGNPQSTALAESQQAAGGVLGASADSPYDVVVTVTDACVPLVSADVAFTWNVTATEIGNPSATVGVTAGSGLTSSTFGNNSFLITNTGDDEIINITINTTTGFMKDVVFDPVGTAGDSTAKCLTAGSNPGGPVGLTAGADGSGPDDCIDIFTQFHNGINDEEGYDIMSLDFTDFNQGEAFSFGIDMDPTTIKGDLTAGDAGSISGFELIGSTISIEFASGVVYTSSLFDENSLGGADAIINGDSNALVAPLLLVDGLNTSRLVTDASQLIEVTGQPNTSVTLLRVDGRLYIDPGNPSVGYDVDLFEANQAMAKQLYTVQLDASGSANIPVTLTQTPGSTGTPNGGLNHFIAVINGPNGENSIASNVIVLEFDPSAIIGPSVLVEITPGADLDTSTYGAGSLQITNNSTGGLQITNVTIDLSTGILPDVIWDPVGAGGDAAAKCFEPSTGATVVGLVVPADVCADPFSQPRNGGFDIMSIDFTEFDPGESFDFAVDIDPNSIQGVAGAGAAGAVSGFELIGAAVTVTFNDNSTITSSIYEDGSLGGGQTIVALQAPLAPSISVVGFGAGPSTVNDLNQTVTVTGTPDDVVSLMLMDSRLYIASNDPPFNVADPTYYANESMDKSLYTGLIGAGGTVDIPIVLLQTVFGNGTPSGGLNQIIAVTSSGAYVPNKQVSQTSNKITLLYDPNAVIDGNVTISYTLQGRTDHTTDLTVNVYEQGSITPVYQFTPTGSAIGEAIITNLAPGTYNIAVKSANYLQIVGTVNVVSGPNILSVGNLKAGDANNDNFVTLEDFSILSATFNKQSSDVGYDGRADFNGDGFVTLEDFSLLGANFNTAGDIVE